MKNILAQTTKPELAKYFDATIFIPTKTSLLEVIKQGLLKTWTELTEGLIKKHLEKYMNTTMGHLYIKLQVLQSTRTTTPDIDLEDNQKLV